MARYNSGARYGSFYYDEPDEPSPNPITTRKFYMRDLHKWLEIPFNDPGISMDELLSFTTDNIQRMTANNTGTMFTARIAATIAALTGVAGAFTDDKTKLGLRKARKMAKDSFRGSLPANISSLASVVIGKYGMNSTVLVECFPDGRGIFNQCADDQVANHIQICLTALTAHVADLGAPVVASATALLAAWNGVYNESETSSGGKTATEAEKRAARAALQMELFKNLLTIALNFPGVPEQLDTFMQQTLLMDHPQQPTPPTPPPPGP